MMNEQFKYDICVVGGCGHVGLPLSLVFASKNLKVLIYDINKQSIDLIQNGKIPFVEARGEELLEEVLTAKTLNLTDDITQLRSARNIIITIGTPVDEFQNPALKSIREFFDNIIPYIRREQLIVLRSTVYPGTTDLMSKYLKNAGCDAPLAFCPERLVQGKGIDEIQSLPQIISGTSPEAKKRACDLFSRISPDLVMLSPLEAEFAKLFTNVYRYIQFAIANQLYMIANSAGVDYEKVRQAVRYNYPRVKDLPSAGFAAGPCLYKDTVQLSAFSDNLFTLGNSAININEGLVYYIVDLMSKKYKLEEMTVGILGMAFKPEVDDIRASLSYKLKKALQYKARNVLCTDPYVTVDPSLIDVEQVLEDSDILILGTPHSVYRSLDISGKIMVDIWGYFNIGTTI
jgi:UDP-N-acetyl-D-mannosaminuronic acid dehydrogenase